MVVEGNQQKNISQAYAKLWTMLKDPDTTTEVLSKKDVDDWRQAATERNTSDTEPTEDTDDTKPKRYIQTIYTEEDEFASLDSLSDALRWKPQE